MEIVLSGLDVVDRDLGTLSPAVTRGCARALNRGIKSGRTFMSRAIAEDTGLPVGAVRDALPLLEATESTLTARLSASLKRIRLIDFKARGSRAGVAYRLPGGPGRLPHAFIATMPSGHEGVFERTPGKFMRFQKPTWRHRRQAIHEKFGPSLGVVFKKHQDAGQARAVEVFESGFDHEVGFAQSQVSDDGAD